MVDLSAYHVTGTNNSGKQVSVTVWNNLLSAIEAGIGAAGGTNVASRVALAALPATKPAILSESGREGVFIPRDTTGLTATIAADTQNGIYVSSTADTTKVWVRQFSGAIDPRWFGIVSNASDSTTKNNNRDRLVALLAYIRATGNVGGTTKVLWPQGDFYFADPGNGYFDLKATVFFEGHTSALSGGRATRLFFDKGGFRANRYNTLNGAVESPATTGADGSIFRNLYMESLQVRPASGVYSSQATSGILAYARVIVEDCWISSFTLDGISLFGGSFSGVGDTNVNNSIVRNCSLHYSGRHGLYIAPGSDNSACRFENLDVSYNSGWGIRDQSFLSNHHSAHHSSFNGGPSHPKSDGLTSIVAYPGTSGSLYYVNPGQATAASTTTPGTNSAVWVPVAEFAGGITANAQWPLWVSGTTYKDGGSYYIVGIGSGVVHNVYTEAGEGQPWGGNTTKFEGGVWEANPNMGGQQETLVGGVHTFKKPVKFEGQLRVPANQPEFGPTSGTATDYTFTFSTTNSYIDIPFMRNGVAMGALSIVNGFGMFLNAAAGITLRYGGNDTAKVTSDGFDLQSGKVLKVAGTQVVGARQTGTPAAATDLATALTLVNDLRTKLISHGLIS